MQNLLSCKSREKQVIERYYFAMLAMAGSQEDGIAMRNDEAILMNK